MNILICSIIRNRGFFMRRMHFLLNHLCRLDKTNKYSISIFENDSTDSTKAFIKLLDWSFFDKTYIQSIDLNLPFLSDSEKDALSKEKLQILAGARNLCIDQVKDDILKYDKILFLEAECLFNPKDIIKLINLSKHTDVYSPKSIMEKPNMIGDSWATRINKEDEIYNGNTDINIPNNFFPLWSTYSYLCIYDIKPILNNIRFGYINNRLNKHDCDTAVICENFRNHGYNRIFMNTNIGVTHI